MDNDSLLLLRSIERWKQTAFDGVDDIGGWRNAVKERAFLSNEPGEWSDPPQGFYGDTEEIVAAIAARCPNLDATPILEVYRAVTTWYSDRSAKRLPPQRVLFATMEQAILVVNAVERICKTEARAPAATGPRPDTADKIKEFPQAIPTDPEQLEFLRRLASEQNKEKRQRQGPTAIARQIVGGDEKAAQALLRAMRRFRTKAKDK